MPSTSSRVRVSNLDAPMGPTLSPKFRSRPRISLSTANAFSCSSQAAEQPLRQGPGLEADSLQTPGPVVKGSREILGVARHLRLPADLAALVDDAHGRLFDGDIQTGIVPHAAFLLLMFVAAPKRRPRLPSARSAAPHLE